MEALSCETPVIATNRGGVPELIEHEVDGYLVSPQNAKELAKAIRYLAKEPLVAKQLAAAGRAKVEHRFNSDLSAIELNTMLEEMRSDGLANSSPTKG